MKKFAAITLAIALCVSLAGCGGQTGVQPNDQSGAPENTEQAVIPSDTPVLSDISGEITVSCFEPMPALSFLEEAAVAFEAQHPGTKVNVTAFSAMPEVRTSSSGGKTVSIMTKEDGNGTEQMDYINKINTELMSGGGADILAVDIIPYLKYAESGQLADLNTFFSADTAFNLADYSENVIRGTAYKGGQYMFPIDYTFDYIAYDSSLLEDAQQEPLQSGGTFTFEGLVDIGRQPFEAAGGQTKMFGMTARGMFDQLFKEHYSHFIDIENKTANFSDGTFAGLLETAASYADEGYIQPGEMIKGGEISMDSFEKARNERFFFKTMNARMLLQQFNRNTGRDMMFAMGSSNAGDTNDDEIAGLIVGEDKSVAYTYNQGYAINANSQNKATAWAFIKFLAGNNMQTSMNLIGMPVRNESRAERAKQEITGQLYAPRQAEMGRPERDQPGIDQPERDQPERDQPGIDQPGTEPPNRDMPFELTAEQTDVLNSYIAALDAFTDMLGVCRIEDATVNAMINTEVDNFFSGVKPADEVAAALQNRVQLYFDE